jgi:hypothetical protein
MAAREHRRQEVREHRREPRHVQVDQLPVALFGHRGKSAVFQDARVVDQHVDGALAALHGGCELPALSGCARSAGSTRTFAL